MNRIGQLSGSVAIAFDLDGTLVETNTANNLAYRKAYQTLCSQYANLPIVFPRITENVLTQSLQNQELVAQLKSVKNLFYASYLHCTHLLGSYVAFRQLDGNYPLYLVTNSDANRAMLLLHYYGLNRSFNGVICKGDIQNGNSKHRELFSRYGIQAENLIVVEDDSVERNKAMQVGVPQDNIFTPSKIEIMNSFRINGNGFLTSVDYVDAYYACDYVRMGQPGNPDFLNYLKNQFNSFAQGLLTSSAYELEQLLLRDLTSIHTLYRGIPLIVCVVPRSLAKNHYSANQLLFAATVKKVVNTLSQQGLNFIDGTDCIERTIDTCTTHLRTWTEHVPEGPEPIPGITNNTCVFNGSVQGKDVLLIDDIYTSNVGIDEDAIQYLFNNGASHVYFYSVGKTR